MSGPSGAGSAVTIRPDPSLPPISVRFCWNFSRHSLNFAYIACICAGEGFPPSPPGRERCRHRYLGMVSLSRELGRQLAVHTMTLERLGFGHLQAPSAVLA